MKIKVGKQEVILDKGDHAKFFIEGYHFSMGTDGYVYRGKYLGYKNGRDIVEKVSFHRFITGAPKGMEVDHINRNRSDNRKLNLRICTKAENVRNRAGKGEFKGVSFCKQTGKWKARIVVDGKETWLGRFDNKKEAALSYNSMAKKLHGEFAYLNKI